LVSENESKSKAADPGVVRNFCHKGTSSHTARNVLEIERGFEIRYDLTVIECFVFHLFIDPDRGKRKFIGGLDIVDTDSIAVARTAIERTRAADSSRKIPFEKIGFVVCVAEAKEEPRLTFLVFGVSPEGQLSIVPGCPGSILRAKSQCGIAVRRKLEPIIPQLEEIVVEPDTV